MNEEDKRSFLGTGWSFPPAFDEHKGGIRMVSEEADIRQSLFILLVVGFVVLTVIGVAFRGEGMALMWPWEVLS